MRLFDFDKFIELFETIRTNPLRTILTGFSVAWGIFMLVVLLGAGKGLENGVFHSFRDDAINSLWISPGQTSKAHQGLQVGRYIEFDNDDYSQVIREIESAEHVTGRFHIQGITTVNYKNETGSYDIRSVHPGHLFLENTIIESGRFINQKDLVEFRKVCVLGNLIKKELFKKENAIGKYIKINSIPFKVVGIFRDEGGEKELKKIYLPITTSQKVFNGKNRIDRLMFTINESDIDIVEQIELHVTNLLATNHSFSPTDSRAIRINNRVEQFKMVSSILWGMRAFVILIGFFTIVAGVVGVSNIMMIVVKERTREIGLRKALGASPFSIVSMVVFESILVTAIAGYFGLVGGIVTIELLGKFVPNADFFRDPNVDIFVAMGSTIFLVLCGTIAGLIPAIKAAKIPPVEALRDE